jgi:hypothetical protein
MASGSVIVLIIFGLIAAGFIGFVVLALVLIGKLIGAAFRALGGPNAAKATRRMPPSRMSQGLVCPHKRCRHINLRHARFCSRCGRPLRSAYDTDLYG